MALNTGHYILNSGHQMPKFGLGTWLSQPGQVQKAVEHAISNGYRHIDCAHCYANQEEVAVAIRNKIADGTVCREDLFITTKLYNIFHRAENVQEGIDINLKQLGLDYIDLLLIHWPVAFKFTDERDMEPLDMETMKMAVDNDDSAHYLNCWNKMIELREQSGYDQKIKSIGVSNFNIEMIKNLLENSSYVPDANQIEGHPYLIQKELTKFCQDNKIQIISYSPLGNPSISSWNGHKKILENDLVLELAEKYEKNNAQILIKFCMQRGNVCIPKSVTESRIVENSEVFDFQISEEDMESLYGLDCGIRYCTPPWSHSKWWPF